MDLFKSLKRSITMHELDLPSSYNISNSFNVSDLSPFNVGFKNSWSNSLQKGEDDKDMTTSPHTM